MATSIKALMVITTGENINNRKPGARRVRRVLNLSPWYNWKTCPCWLVTQEFKMVCFRVTLKYNEMTYGHAELRACFTIKNPLFVTLCVCDCRCRCSSLSLFVCKQIKDRTLPHTLTHYMLHGAWACLYEFIKSVLFCIMLSQQRTIYPIYHTVIVGN